MIRLASYNVENLFERAKILNQNEWVQVVAAGRSDWIGRVELKTEAVNEISTQNNARVIGNINADIVAPEITNENQAASDHAALYADLDLARTA